MTNQKHKHNPSPKVKSTPGPWVIHPDHKNQVFSRHLDMPEVAYNLKSLVADCSQGTMENYQAQCANARLIAAAPDMLKALIFAKDYVINLQYAGILNMADGEGMEVIQYFIDTIAKAEGGAE